VHPWFARDDPHRRDKIGIIGQQGGVVEGVPEGVAHKMHAEVHVRAFFLGLPT